MSPGLYPCSVHDHDHIFVLHQDGRWSELKKTTLHGGMGSPRATCELMQGAGAQWITRHVNGTTGGADNVETTTLRKHATANNPAARNPHVREGRIVRVLG
jgi:hypothetical protein